MKELSIEEKAKRYDEVVNEIKKLRDILLKEGVINENGIICDNLNRIFPELNETDGKKTRKEILDYIIKGSESFYDVQQYGKEKFKKWIAWLEKQGESKSNWKPSEEQYEALTYAYNICSDTDRGNFYDYDYDAAKVELLEEFENFIDTLEVKDVDLEKEFYNFLDTLTGKDNGHLSEDELFRIAEYFFELGLKVQKGV